MTYRNPPANTKWQKGQSGNPSGRKPDRHIRDIIREVLEAEAIDKRGNSLAISNVEVAVRTLLQQCVNGNMRAAELLFNYGYGKPNQHLEIEDNRAEERFNEKALQEAVSKLDTETLERMLKDVEG